MAAQTDFFDTKFGGCKPLSWKSRHLGRFTDPLFDWRLQQNPSYRALDKKAAQMPRRKILLTGVEVPGRENDLKDIMQGLSKTRHEVTLLPAKMGKDRGKF